jgi:2-amino-4-hydroxy-6-hydroxymethyldihydropteridine diphosphokinase
MKKNAFLSLGSNLGDRAANLDAAIAALGSLGEILKVSSFYETAPVDVTHQPWFLNCVVGLETEKMPKQLLSSVLKIERQLGRNRAKEQNKGPRTIDLDILLFGNSIIDSKELTVPHPAMHLRRFVLEPFAEIAPEIIHPVLKQTVRQLLNALPPGQAVRKFGGEAFRA